MITYNLNISESVVHPYLDLHSDVQGGPLPHWAEQRALGDTREYWCYYTTLLIIY